MPETFIDRATSAAANLLPWSEAAIVIVWRETSSLRIARRNVSDLIFTRVEQVLQQAWVSNLGTVEWRDVPVVDEGA